MQKIRPRLGERSAALVETKAIASNHLRIANSSVVGEVEVYPPRHGNVPASDNGGTACQCICGDRVVWNREVFAGDVVVQKEHECEHEVCPRLTVPGLKVQSKCTYYKDMKELTAGTLCNCQCGDNCKGCPQVDCSRLEGAVEVHILQRHEQS